MATKIVFNGTEYSSVEEMPPDVRQAYEQMMGIFLDKNQNGLPDAWEGMIAAHSDAAFNAIQFDGLTYTNLDQMPPEARQAYERAMSALNVFGDSNRNGIPDIVEGALNMPAQAAPQPQQPALVSRPIAPSATPSHAPVISGDVESSDRNLRLLIVGGGIIVLLGVIAVLLAFIVYSQYFAPR
jgi:hypothetical protein